MLRVNDAAQSVENREHLIVPTLRRGKDGDDVGVPLEPTIFERDGVAVVRGQTALAEIVAAIAVRLEVEEQSGDWPAVQQARRNAMRAVDDDVVAPDGNHGLLRVESFHADGVERFVERTNVVFDAVLPSVALTAGTVRKSANVLVIKFLRPAALDTERTMPRVEVLG